VRTVDGRDDDDELVAMARAPGSRDTRAFETLVHRHQGFVAANCRAITRSSSDAEDLAQEVFVKAFFALRRFEGRARFRTWLGRIKVNHCLNHLKRTRGAIMVDIDEVEPEGHRALAVPPTAHVEAVSAADREQIVDILDTMPDTLRIPLMLRDADGQSYDEIASQLAISLPAVKMRIKRAREMFRARFADAAARPPAAFARQEVR
jgi:RNA polymerase sigma-70 factor, ECF subfamily